MCELVKFETLVGDFKIAVPNILVILSAVGIIKIHRAVGLVCYVTVQILLAGFFILCPAVTRKMIVAAEQNARANLVAVFFQVCACLATNDVAVVSVGKVL